MTWLRPVDRTSGTLTLSAGTLSCLAHHGTPLSKRCPTTTALEHTIVPMDDAERMPPLGAVKPRQKFFNVIHRALCSPLEFRHERRAAGWADGLTARCHSGARFARAAAVRDFGWAEDGNGSKAEYLPNARMSAFASSSGHTSARAFSSFGRVEDGRGSLGRVATLRFPSPLIEPDVRISRIRLSDWLHRKAHERNH